MAATSSSSSSSSATSLPPSYNKEAGEVSKGSSPEMATAIPSNRPPSPARLSDADLLRSITRVSAYKSVCTAHAIDPTAMPAPQALPTESKFPAAAPNDSATAAVPRSLTPGPTTKPVLAPSDAHKDHRRKSADEEPRHDDHKVSEERKEAKKDDDDGDDRLDNDIEEGGEDEEDDDEKTSPTPSYMVDHTYHDFSFVTEDELRRLDDHTEDDAKEAIAAALSSVGREDGGKGDAEEDTTVTKPTRSERVKALRRLRKLHELIWATRRNGGGIVKPFPVKVMEVLDRGDLEQILSWLPHGRSFVVKKPNAFAENVLPRFFKQTKIMSFTRQLNLWGFKRISKGPDTGAYYHELFLRGKGHLTCRMRRLKVKGTGIKLTPNPDDEPDFYALAKKRPLPPKKREGPPPPLPPISPVALKALEELRRKRNASGPPSEESNAHEEGRKRIAHQHMPPNDINALVRNSSLHGSLTGPGLAGHQGPVGILSIPLHQQRQDCVEHLLAAQLEQQTAKSAMLQRQVQQQHRQAVSSAHGLLEHVKLLGQPHIGPSSNSVANLKQRLIAAALALDESAPMPSFHQQSARPQLDPFRQHALAASSFSFPYGSVGGNLAPHSSLGSLDASALPRRDAGASELLATTSALREAVRAQEEASGRVTASQAQAQAALHRYAATQASSAGTPARRNLPSSFPGAAASRVALSGAHGFGISEASLLGRERVLSSHELSGAHRTPPEDVLSIADTTR